MNEIDNKHRSGMNEIDNKHRSGMNEIDNKHRSGTNEIDNKLKRIVWQFVYSVIRTYYLVFTTESALTIT